MTGCKLYPNFLIQLDSGLAAEYRKNGKSFEKRTLYGILYGDEPDDWRECSMANYALALLKAHEQAEG